MTIWQSILLGTGIALSVAGIAWMAVRSAQAKKEDKGSVTGDLIDAVIIESLFFTLSIFRDILRAIFACFQKPSRKNAPELMTIGGAILIALSFSVGN